MRPSCVKCCEARGGDGRSANFLVLSLPTKSFLFFLYKVRGGQSRGAGGDLRGRLGDPLNRGQLEDTRRFPHPQCRISPPSGGDERHPHALSLPSESASPSHPAPTAPAAAGRNRRLPGVTLEPRSSPLECAPQRPCDLQGRKVLVPWAA